MIAELRDLVTNFFFPATAPAEPEKDPEPPTSVCEVRAADYYALLKGRAVYPFSPCPQEPKTLGSAAYPYVARPEDDRPRPIYPYIKR